jgi:hypothetical protein
MARARPGTLKVLTANDLLSGDVVFLHADGRWQTALQGARVAATPAEAESLEALATAPETEAETVGAYLIDVVRDAGGTLAPVRYREALRTLGPSVRTDLGRQAEAAAEAANGGDHVSL